MFDRLFRQIDETRARAARDAGLPDAPAETHPPAHPFVRFLGRLVFIWVAILIGFAIAGGGVERIGWLTPLVVLPGVAIRIGSALGLVPDRIVGRRTGREGALLGLVFWVVAALVSWVDAGLGAVASIGLVLLLLRRLNRIVLTGMYQVERQRIRRGRGASERLAESGSALDGRPGAQEIAAMTDHREENR
jgi:hypothetical protein